MYANYFQIGFNAFEFFLDFGKWLDVFSPGTIHTRIVTAPRDARDLYDLLGGSLGDFEKAHGSLDERVEDSAEEEQK